MNKQRYLKSTKPVAVLASAALVLGGIFWFNHPTQAETPGGTCVVATQDSYDKILAQYPERYSATDDTTKTKVIIKKTTSHQPW